MKGFAFNISEFKMNPITQTRNQMKLNERELEMGLAGTKNSWHQEYKVDRKIDKEINRYLDRWCG